MEFCRQACPHGIGWVGSSKNISLSSSSSSSSSSPSSSSSSSLCFVAQLQGRCFVAQLQGRWVKNVTDRGGIRFYRVGMLGLFTFTLCVCVCVCVYRAPRLLVHSHINGQVKFKILKYNIVMRVFSWWLATKDWVSYKLTWNLGCEF